jgi:preprotein translocase subunit SecD
MLEFPRWKYVLVVLVMLVAALLALPNLFGEDPALQVERKDRTPMDFQARQNIEDLLRKQQIPIKRDYIDNGRLIVAFNDVASQIKARDTVDATLADVDRSALSNASRAPAWMRDLGLKAMPLGLDLRGGLYLLYQVDVGGAVSQLLESYQQSFRRALTDAKLPVTDIVVFNSGAGPTMDGLRVTLAAGADVGTVISTLRKVDNTLNFRSVSGPAGPEIEMVLTPVQIKARED